MIDVEKIRKRLGLTQEQLARELEVSVTTVNRWERDHHIPSPLAVRAIERLLEKSEKRDQEGVS
jgi:DNA-binding transcriptional regulator YiaG